MDGQLRSFIRATFRSVWDLELLLQLKRQEGRSLAPGELVSALRASDSVVSTSGAALLTAGLVVAEADGKLRYAPAAADLSTLVDQTEALYRQRPDAVRRIIAGGGGSDLDAFAKAFRLRKDQDD